MTTRRRVNRRRRINIESGYYDGTGFHPIRASRDYDPDRAGDEYSDVPKRKKKKGKKKNSAHSRRLPFRPAKRKAKTNPLPSRWTAARVRVNARGEEEIMLLGKAAKQAVRRARGKR